MNTAELRILWKMCVFEAQRFRSFPTEALATVLSRGIMTVLYVTFWVIVAQHATSQDIEVGNIVGYYLITSGLIPFFYSHFGVASESLRQIKSGTLNQVLIKPLNPIFYPWAIRTGRNLVGLIIGSVLATVGIFISGGLSWDSTLFLLPVIANAFAINMAFNILIASVGFYLIDASGFKNAFLHVARLCRGEYIPLYLMPTSVFAALQWTPFPASQYHLTVVLQGSNLPSWGAVVTGSIWATTLLWLSIKLWKYSLRKYEAVGI